MSAMVAVSSYANGIILVAHETSLAEKIQDSLATDAEFEQLLERKSSERLRGIVSKWKDQI
jgi:hypothetical protein